MIWAVLPVVFLIVGLIAGFFFIRGVQERRTREVMRKFTGRQVWAVASNATFFGRKSRGRSQVRGNGVLVLGDDGLYFELWAPRQAMHIPYRNVLGVETPRGFLSKTRFRPLLKVDFRNEENQRDAAAWQVRDPERYVTLLRDLTQASRR